MKDTKSNLNIKRDIKNKKANIIKVVQGAFLAGCDHLILKCLTLFAFHRVLWKRAL